MPGMGGTQLMEAVKSLIPGVKVLLISGYSGDAMTRHGTTGTWDSGGRPPPPAAAAGPRTRFGSMAPVEYDESGCSTRTPRSSASPTPGPRWCAGSRSRWPTAAGSARWLGRGPARAGVPARRGPERPHLGHRGPGPRPPPAGRRPARPRPLRRRPRGVAVGAAPRRRRGGGGTGAGPRCPGGHRHVAGRPHRPGPLGPRPRTGARGAGRHHPRGDPGQGQAVIAFIDGPESFADFDEILARTVEFNPTRSVSSLRRGILHNAVQRDDGTWVWRHARFRAGEAAARPEFGDLWGAVSGLRVPVLLVRGSAPGSVVDDADEAELLRRQPDAQVERVADAGHSIQGDQPVELARLIDALRP